MAAFKGTGNQQLQGPCRGGHKGPATPAALRLSTGGPKALWEAASSLLEASDSTSRRGWHSCAAPARDGSRSVGICNLWAEPWSFQLLPKEKLVDIYNILKEPSHLNLWTLMLPLI